ncbi:Utp21-domain-containing protein [Dacryopinax primogenitus]|uniref:Utp21-domain-containing protein n=1 Tax=Dacryopinax primogenitus (strain DJM 731) TaxID=1858805 RepID=M5FYB1_DACPD|nr:Utp21-domain-containing protein [Dacryopinax primogenitus]EJU00815.1 Utp21-domain-containing protein [Dacryopinax primogenitus]
MDVDEPSPPPAKRLKTTRERATKQHSKQSIFAPFRALGLVTNHVPFAVQLRSYKGSTEGPQIHILTCIGQSWLLWEGGKMRLLFVGQEAPLPLSAVAFDAVDGDYIWAAAGPHLIKYYRGKEVTRITSPEEVNISQILCFGSQILALSEDGSKLFIWHTPANELYTTIDFPPDFTATHLLHPATYLNKVLIGSAQGALQLWNIRTRTHLFTFPSSRFSSAVGSHAVTCLVQSPAVDVVAIGFSSSQAIVYNIRTDESIMKLSMASGGIRAMAFRSDNEPILATASSTGQIATWDLSKSARLVHLSRMAHGAGVTALYFVPGQPLLLSAGEDNSVKQWLFDSPLAPPRFLKGRSGHSRSPHLVRYYGHDGKNILTASADRSLRCVSVVRDSRSFELSQGSIEKKASAMHISADEFKLPPAIAISWSETRTKDWDDIMTGHGEAGARSWWLLEKRIGKFSFGAGNRGSGPSVSGVRAVCVSACGNFGLAGTEDGSVGMWNLQSGILRKSFDLTKPVKGEKKKKAKESEKIVTGIVTDALNRMVVVSTLAGTLHFFDFYTTEPQAVVTLPSAAVSVVLHRGNNMLAVNCEDLVVRILDIETRRTVRELRGFKGKVLDLAFSPDSRWLITTSLDSIIRTFDIPSGCLIDAFRVNSIATSLSFSPTADFLATSHVDSVGLYLWTNRAQFTEVITKSVQEDEIVELNLPSMQGVDEAEGLEALEGEILPPSDIYATPQQLADGLVTLTLLPHSRWQTLLNLETIQQRNKPKEPPKPPEKAPFFLPTLPGTEQRFALDAQAPDKGTGKMHLNRGVLASVESEFVRKLLEEDNNGKYELFFNYVKALSPAAIDLELRSLSSTKHLVLFIHALTQRLSTHRDFEAVQTFVDVFLRIHGDVLIVNEETMGPLQELAEVQKRESERVLELITSSLGTLSFVRQVA